MNVMNLKYYCLCS